MVACGGQLSCPNYCLFIYAIGAKNSCIGCRAGDQRTSGTILELELVPDVLWSPAPVPEPTLLWLFTEVATWKNLTNFISTQKYGRLAGNCLALIIAFFMYLQLARSRAGDQRTSGTKLELELVPDVLWSHAPVPEPAFLLLTCKNLMIFYFTGLSTLLRILLILI